MSLMLGAIISGSNMSKALAAAYCYLY